jgi:ribosomal protein S12 methylthiotransferase
MTHSEKNIHIITLGCSKNLADSEKLHFQLSKAGYNVTHNKDFNSCDTVIINTCGFINDAKEESINTIMDAISLKTAGRIKKIIVFGCLAERYMNELKSEISEVDTWLGNYNAENLLHAIGKSTLNKPEYGRHPGNHGHYAYLKIAEGCNRTCAFCAIPLIKGKFVSQSKENILEEAKWLSENGVKELLLIAQDLSYYGRDIYKQAMLPKLVEEISNINNIEWIRLHYLYPALFPEDLIDLMAENNKICKYADIPFQHISDNMLKAMKRLHNKASSIKLIENFRNKIPGVALRTTLLTGFPGETDKDFEELLDFVKQVEFDRLGVFTYSHEEKTYAGENLKDDIPQKIKEERAAYIMEIQEAISFKKNKDKIGKTIKVIVDSFDGENYYGRTEYDSVEVDNEVIFTSAKLINIGEFINVKVNSADSFELFGTA